MPGKISAETEFIYHNVGNGLFYTGEIKLKDPNENTFRFIYDCGSEKKQLIDTSISRFKQYINSNEIDLLIISHLHSDHVNGLKVLFDNFKIKEVILPYFTPIERLLIALKREDIPKFYLNFFNRSCYLFN